MECEQREQFVAVIFICFVLGAPFLIVVYAIMTAKKEKNKSKI